MKKFTILLSISLLLIASLSGCQQSKDKTEDTETSTPDDSSAMDDMNMAKVEYTCSMHPEVISDKPGKCPKCGMDLVKKEEGHEHMEGDSTEHAQ